jgi:hypothetical protein
MRPDEFDAVSRSLASSFSRRSVLRFLGFGAASGAILAGGLTEAIAKRRSDDSPLQNIEVSGVDATGEEVFTGTLDVKRFVASDDQIYALGKLTGTLTKNGKEHRIKRGVRLPVALAASGLPEDGGSEVAIQQVACGILDLTLGPLDLNLLGLRVQLSQIDLTITAVPGGGLLGDLLCAIAGLLDPRGSLRQIMRLLNRLLDLLG